MTTITIQPGQPGEGMEYNPAEPLPYPIFVGDDDRCENVPGYPPNRVGVERDTLPILVGFQPDVETQSVDLLAEDWRRDPSTAIGMVPVFFEPGGISEGMFSLAVQITSVHAA